MCQVRGINAERKTTFNCYQINESYYKAPKKSRGNIEARGKWMLTIRGIKVYAVTRRGLCLQT